MTEKAQLSPQNADIYVKFLKYPYLYVSNVLFQKPPTDLFAILQIWLLEPQQKGQRKRFRRVLKNMKKNKGIETLIKIL